MYIKDGKRFNIHSAQTLNGIKYPADFFRDPEARQVHNIEWVDEPLKEDPKYYFVQELDVAPFVENIPRDLTQCKEEAIARTKQEASSILSETDWKVIRASETGEPLSPEFLEERAQVRALSNEKESLINACTTIQELQTLGF